MGNAIQLSLISRPTRVRGVRSTNRLPRYLMDENARLIPLGPPPLPSSPPNIRFVVEGRLSKLRDSVTITKYQAINSRAPFGIPSHPHPPPHCSEQLVTSEIAIGPPPQ
ncbi:hypothetical protein CDAR_485481 [Caerostris darwini]|uniref:Uncharacterized protein n=1 Tax=Caerostris darwini TaxID=1538125 RepID=A0AAV4PDU9_9ARAC|nr:hypothetical protein CDAR_485481 [Caerostris darwini]